MNSGKLCKNAVIYCDGKSKKEFSQQTQCCMYYLHDLDKKRIERNLLSEFLKNLKI